MPHGSTHLSIPNEICLYMDDVTHFTMCKFTRRDNNYDMLVKAISTQLVLWEQDDKTMSSLPSSDQDALLKMISKTSEANSRKLDVMCDEKQVEDHKRDIGKHEHRAYPFDIELTY
jgi:hypothetical protein